MNPRTLLFIFRCPSSLTVVPLFLLVVPLSGANFFPIVPGIGEGNTFSTIPFTGSSNSVRFQQVYDSAAFTFYGEQPYLINSIRFREDADHQFGFSSDFPLFQVTLSTTPRSVDSLSTVFSENVGLNEMVVVPQGPFHIGISSVSEFSAVINLPTPFYYDPSQGNLLLDIRNFGGGSTGWGVPPFFGPAYVDAANVVGDSVSRVFANNVNALFGTADSLGLVTQLSITPVPEPSILVLLAVGLGVLATGWQHRRKG